LKSHPSISLISYYTLQGASITDLEKYIILKTAYCNSDIYNYSARKAEQDGRLPWKRTCIAKVVARMKELGWAKMQGATLKLISKHELTVLYAPLSKHDYKYIKIDRKVKDFVTYLRSTLLNTMLNRIAYAKSKKLAQNSSAQKKILKNVRGQYVWISYRYMGKLWGKSKSSAKRQMQKCLKAKHFLRKKSEKEILFEGISARAWQERHLWWKKEDVPMSMCFWWNGLVYFFPPHKFKAHGIC